MLATYLKKRQGTKILFLHMLPLGPSDFSAKGSNMTMAGIIPGISNCVEILVCETDRSKDSYLLHSLLIITTNHAEYCSFVQCSPITRDLLSSSLLSTVTERTLFLKTKPAGGKPIPGGA
jgi:hypothetical protein